MAVGVAFLRGVNVGGKGKLPMDVLRDLCAEAGLLDARTYIQSGNVVFRASTGRGGAEAGLAAGRLEALIERRCGFRPSVVMRTAAELRRVISHSPFAARKGMDPARLVVMFPSGTPDAASRKAAAAIKADPEELRLVGREMHLYFPNGIGKSRLSMASVERALGTPGTCRNWNTTLKMLAMAEELEASA